MNTYTHFKRKHLTRVILVLVAVATAGISFTGCQQNYSCPAYSIAKVEPVHKPVHAKNGLNTKKKTAHYKFKKPKHWYSSLLGQ